MKRFLFFSVVLVAALCVCVYAKSGDVAGKYYSTDIETTLNGEAIDAINIGGQTLISAEDMQHYGFYVVWNEDARVLDILENKTETQRVEPIGPPSSVCVVPGTPIGRYFETDIRTFLDQAPITAYNTGGKTYIHAEAMRSFGYDVVWNEKARTLAITSPYFGGYCFDLPLSRAAVKGENDPVAQGNASVSYTKDAVTCQGEADYFDLTLHGNGKSYCFDMVFYQYQALFRSSDLIDNLKKLCSGEKSLNVGVVINGQVAKEVRVTAGQGNGHYDFFFEVSGLPKWKLDEIEEISFTVAEPFKIAYRSDMGYTDAIAKFNDGKDFKTLHSVDTADYTFIIAQDLHSTDANNLQYVSVAKRGGFVVLFENLNHYEETKLEANGNTVCLTVYPFAGPHGPTRCTTEYDLDLFKY